MKKLLLLLTLALGGASFAQTNLNISLLGRANYQYDNNDIWGYTDSSGTEYALVGTEAGVSIVDVSANPPSKRQFISGPFSIWRDLKTWDHYAYVTHDNPYAWDTTPEQGLLIIDLDSINAPNARFKSINFAIPDTLGGYDTLLTAHNLYIDENGYCYLFGANIRNGGALIFNLNNDPWNPEYVGLWDDYYLHDGMVRGDTLWGSAVYAGRYVIVDVSTKDSAYMRASKATPNAFTHNTWISDDNRTLFTTDEVGGAFLTAYDVSDLSNMTELDRIQSLPGTTVIPHNAHVYGQWVVTSYYTSGVQIVDAKFPQLLVEVGYYDTSPSYMGNGFNGNWGAYPYFQSEKIICSDIEEGLYVLDPEYVSASRVHVEVIDSITRGPLSNVTVDFNAADIDELTSIDGWADLGTPRSGADSVTISLSGYVTDERAFIWTPGSFDTLRVALLNVNNIGITDAERPSITLYPNPSQGSISISGFAGGTYELLDLSGRSLETGACNNNTLQLENVYKSGQYFLRLYNEEYTRTFPLTIHH